MDGVFILFVGAVLLIGGFIGLLKIGLWVWIATNIFHKPPNPYAPPVPVAQSGGGLKTTLATISTILGLLATCVGLLKDCDELANGHEPALPAQQPIVQPVYQPQPVNDGSGLYQMQGPKPQPMLQYGQTCCTPQGNCPMIMAGQVGLECTCANAFGFAVGTVCQ